MNRAPTYHDSRETGDFRDLAREHLALCEAELRERVAGLEEDIAAYAELLSVALQQNHDLLAERDRLKTRLAALLISLRKIQCRERRAA